MLAADAADKQGQRTIALEKLKSAAVAAPADFKVQYELALAFRRFGQEPSFLAHLEKAIRLKGASALKQWAGLSEAYLDESDYANAKRVLQEDILPQWPGSGEACFLQGRLAMVQAKGKPDIARAVEHFERCLELQPDNAQARYHFAVCCFRDGDMDRAENELRKVLEGSPQFLPALHQMGEILRKKGKWEEAGPFLEKHQQLDAKLQRLRYLQVQYSLGRYSSPDLLELGQLYLEMDRLTAARGTFHLYTKLEPKDPEGHRHLAEVYARLHNALEAKSESQLAEALALAKEQP
jgi:tetratricopeptide (TPR) repeat protein